MQYLSQQQIFIMIICLITARLHVTEYVHLMSHLYLNKIVTLRKWVLFVECKKKIFVLIIVLLLSFVPQGIYWYCPPEYSYDIAIPYRLFGLSEDRVLEEYQDMNILNSQELVQGQMYGMKFVTYLYVAATCLMLIQYISKMYRKKEIRNRKGVMFGYAVISAVQFVGACVFLFKEEELRGGWSWMAEISAIQCAVAVLLYIVENVPGIINCLCNIFCRVLKEIIYITCLLFSFACCSFRYVLENHEYTGWRNYDLFFGKPSFYNMDRDSKWLCIVVGICLPICVSLLLGNKIKRIAIVKNMLDVLAVVYLCIVVWQSVFSAQMNDARCYFMPDVMVIITVTLSCVRLLDNDRSETYGEY